MDSLNAFKAAVITVTGALTGLWGWLGWLVLGWLCCMILDLITGTCAALRNGEWSSRKAREGIWHKVGMVAVAIAAGMADVLLNAVLTYLPVINLPFDYPGVVCPVVLVWYIITELGSVLENAVIMGASVPTWLTRMLRLSKNTIDSTAEKLWPDEAAKGKDV